MERREEIFVSISKEFFPRIDWFVISRHRTEIADSSEVGFYMVRADVNTTYQKFDRLRFFHSISLSHTFHSVCVCVCMCMCVCVCVRVIGKENTSLSV